MTAPPLLAVSNLRAGYGAVEVLRDVHLEVDQGGVTALLGANGAGKTTTLRALSGLIRARGSIVFDGAPIVGLKADRVARLGIGHVPDGRGTFKELTVDENLRLGSYSRGRADKRSGIARVLEYFPRLSERMSQQAGTLSGGEQQMLAISRALLLRPRLLLLDEPSFGLAPLVVAEIFAIMRRINEQEGVGILLVEQNAKVALRMASRAYVLETGRVVLSGSADEIGRDESVRRSYLGY